MKTNIVGTTASGKSTFGKKLAEATGAPYIEMDEIFWGPNWTEPSDNEFFKNLEAAISVDAWVLDGNYSRTTPIKWREVDTVIWLDYSFYKTIKQSIFRSVNRLYFKSELWPNTGNYETVRKLFSKKSIIWWCIKNYSKNRDRYKKVMKNPDYAHIQFVRLKSHKEAEDYILSLTPAKRS